MKHGSPGRVKRRVVDSNGELSGQRVQTGFGSLEIRVLQEYVGQHGRKPRPESKQDYRFLKIPLQCIRE